MISRRAMILGSSALWAAPANACDCHMHFYNSRYPVDPRATVRPPDASVDDYRAVQKRIGTSRVVVVTPSTYGTDNRCTLDAMAQFGAAARGVAVVDSSVTDAELKRLAGLGIRGIRFNLVQRGATTIEMLEPLSRRVNDLGWHLQLQMNGDEIVRIADLLQRLPSPIVFDHMGRLPAFPHPAFSVILKLIDRGRAWVKLSGPYLESKSGPPRYEDSTRIAQDFVKAAPQRLVWGSDWPHPTATHKVDDLGLMNLLSEWAPNETTRRRILVDNPARLYSFA